MCKAKLEKIKFWRDRSALMRRAHELFGRHSAVVKLVEYFRGRGRDSFVTEPAFENGFLVAITFGLCVALAWAEFKTKELWLPTDEAGEKFGYTGRQIRNWIKDKLVIGAFVTDGSGKTFLYVNMNSLEEYIDGLPSLNPEKEYVECSEVAALLSKTTQTVRNWYRAGRLAGEIVKNILYIERSSLEALA